MLDRQELLKPELELVAKATSEADAAKLVMSYKAEEQAALASLLAVADKVIDAVNATCPAPDAYDELLKKALEAEPPQVKDASDAYRKELSDKETERVNKEDTLRRAKREREDAENALKASEKDYQEAVTGLASLPKDVTDKLAEIAKVEQDIVQLLKEGPAGRIDAARTHRAELTGNLDKLRNADEFKTRWGAVTEAWKRLNDRAELRAKQQAETNAGRDLDSVTAQLKDRQTNSAKHIYLKYKARQKP